MAKREVSVRSETSLASDGGDGSLCECLSLQCLSLSPSLSNHQQVRALVERGVATRQRSLFVIVGDKARDQVSE